MLEMDDTRERYRRSSVASRCIGTRTRLARMKGNDLDLRFAR